MSDTEVTIEQNRTSQEKGRGCCGRKPASENEVKSVSIGQILALSRDSYWMMFLGALLSLINGAAFPVFSIVFGQLFNVFLDPTIENREEQIRNISLYFLAIAAGAFLCSYFSNVLWIIVGERIVRKLRQRFFDALLRQEVAFFDNNQSGVLVSRLSADAQVVQSGVSEKFVMLFSYIAQIVGGIVVAFVYGWEMTLVMLACSPAIIIVGALQNFMLKRAAQSGQTQYATSNNVAQEVISGIRTIYSFVAEQRSSRAYADRLKNSYKDGVKRAHLTGLGIGFSLFFMFGIYAIGFWYGGKLVIEGKMQGGDVLTVFFAIVVGAMGIGQASSITPDLARASGAAAILFDIIKRVPGIESEGGLKSEKGIKGKIRFKNVKFAYPSRPQSTVLENFNLEVKPGKTVALAGPSGGGKSTVVQLIERFYDAVEGQVLIDGVDIREYDLKWLRSQIGLVSQEPILFSGTIAENIRYGKEDATMEEVEHAAKLANAHDFIMRLKDGYNTQVGEKGHMLSGGEKQRVAIARAVLKNPKILLLDEATSALDNNSEKLVQDALDKLMKGRTTIVIAHRLTTIKDADCICVIKNGKIVESGSHEELLEKGGEYSELFKRQFNQFDEEPLQTTSKRSKKKSSKATEN